MRDVWAAEGVEIVKWQARRYRNLPPGLNVDDLESAGNEAIVEALTLYDSSAGHGFKPFCVGRVRGRMKDLIRAARRRARLGAPVGGEVEIEHADRRADDPAANAGAREMVALNRDSLVRVRQHLRDPLEEALPPPDAVAERAAKLRSVLFEAITPESVRATMEAVLAKAQAGDIRAAKVVIDLIVPKAAVTAQAAVVLAPERVGE